MTYSYLTHYQRIARSQESQICQSLSGELFHLQAGYDYNDYVCAHVPDYSFLMPVGAGSHTLKVHNQQHLMMSTRFVRISRKLHSRLYKLAIHGRALTGILLQGIVTSTTTHKKSITSVCYESFCIVNEIPIPMNILTKQD